MSVNLLKTNEFDVSNVSFTLKVDKVSKKKIFYVNHNKKPILFQTPKMYLPNGIKHWDSGDYPESYELEVSFGEDKENSKNNVLIKEFESKMTQLDELIKAQIFENPQDWIGEKKPTDKDDIEFLRKNITKTHYKNHMIRVPKDKDGNVLAFPNRMRIKVDRERENDEFTGYFASNRRHKTRVMMFDSDGTNLELSESNFKEVVPPGSKSILVLELVNISLIGGKVYPKWKLIQGKVYRNLASITDNIIQDEDDQEYPADLDSMDPEVPVVVEEVQVEAPVVEEIPVEDEFEEVKPVKKGKKGKSAAA